MAIKVFCCYAREDEGYLSKLRTHLKPLERKGVIEVWHDGEISAGTKWEAELHKQLNTAQIILFLVSPYFISSDYCYDKEMVEAVKRHEKGEATVIPVILSPVNWQETPFGHLQVLPKNAKPLTKWRNRHDAIFNAADGIKQVVYELLLNPESKSKTALSPNDADPELPIAEEKSSGKQNDVEEQIFDSDKHKNKSFEEQRILAAQLLEKKHPQRALEILSRVSIEQLPTSLRWRLATLRGECYFNMSEFLLAQHEFRSAHAILPDYIPPDQRMEALLLYLHLASATRELGQYEIAYEQFRYACAHLDASTSVRFVAEAYWGMSLVLYEQAYKLWNKVESVRWQNQQETKKEFLSLMEQSLNYAENTCTLYKMVKELYRSALMNCQIALIEQAMENLKAARARLKKVLNEWLPTLQVEMQNSSRDMEDKMKRFQLKERANIVSAAACYLASVELDAQDCTSALKYVDMALQAGKDSYIVRRADAYMTRGQILAASNDPGAIDAFRQALAELEPTDRVGAKIRVHKMLGAYLIKQGDDRGGNAELEKALRLANVPSAYAADNIDSDSSLRNEL